MSDIARVKGSIFRAFLSASESFHLLLRGNIEHLDSYDPNAWYPAEELEILLSLVRKCGDSPCILEQIGVEMMRCWFGPGHGRNTIRSGLDFLRLQKDSVGYLSVVSGPDSLIGRFELESLNPSTGAARVRSSSVFPRSLERGILLGGLGLGSDLLYFTVEHGVDPDLFDIRLVTTENRDRFLGLSGETVSELEWRFRHHLRMNEERERFWLGINEALRAAYAEVSLLATLDPLTGVYNRREFYRLADIELAKSKRSGCPATLLYLDLDHFKRINDTQGHDTGDRALSAFADLCRSICRHYDLIGRIGGEELCILLPLTGLAPAMDAAERILSRTRKLAVAGQNGPIGFTVSIGLSSYDGVEALPDLMLRADKALLRAKQLGRDRIVRSD